MTSSSNIHLTFSTNLSSQLGSNFFLPVFLLRCLKKWVKIFSCFYFTMHRIDISSCIYFIYVVSFFQKKKRKKEKKWDKTDDKVNEASFFPFSKKEFNLKKE